MITTINPSEIHLILSGEKRSDLVADPRNRWKAGMKVHLWSDWPFRDTAHPIGVFQCTGFHYAQLVLRDGYCHLYLSESPTGTPPVDVIRFDSDAMKELARMEGYDGIGDFLSSYFPGWEYADPDEWQIWKGKLIYFK